MKTLTSIRILTSLLAVNAGALWGVPTAANPAGADAFTDFKADVRYAYSRAGFEQDIILHERSPGPEAHGLNHLSN